jgi:hypothetical protein
MDKRGNRQEQDDYEGDAGGPQTPATQRRNRSDRHRL